MLDNLIYIGRFQPFHEGHKKVIDFALSKSKFVTILIGSSNLHRSVKNPFTFEERREMILSVYDNRWRDKNVEKFIGERIKILPINDYPYNEIEWIGHVQQVVDAYTNSDKNTGIIGYDKDASNDMSIHFPNWERVDMHERIGTLNATSMRNQYFQDAPIVSTFIPEEVREYLKEFAMTPAFKWLLNEAKFLREYKEEYGPGPFVTVDAVVEQSGHILLIERGEAPFKGALALPGGFLNPNERIIDASVRELKEETRVADEKGEIPPAMLRSFIKDSHVFDDIERDPRARLITHAYHYQFPMRPELFKVRGDDDAASAKWYRIADLRPDMFMADHAFILQHFLGVSWD